MFVHHGAVCPGGDHDELPGGLLPRHQRRARPGPHPAGAGRSLSRGEQCGRRSGGGDPLPGGPVPHCALYAGPGCRGDRAGGALRRLFSKGTRHSSGLVLGRVLPDCRAGPAGKGLLRGPGPARERCWDAAPAPGSGGAGPGGSGAGCGAVAFFHRHRNVRGTLFAGNR